MPPRIVKLGPIYLGCMIDEHPRLSLESCRIFSFPRYSCVPGVGLELPPGLMIPPPAQSKVGLDSFNCLSLESTPWNLATSPSLE